MLQDAASLIIEFIIEFYDFVIMIIIIIIMLIIYILVFILFNKFIDRNLLEHQWLEIIWTIVPIFILIYLAFPSLKVLYITDELNNPLFTFKAIAHQWYWEYEYYFNFKINEFIVDNFDSIINKTVELNRFRLLDVSENFLIPIKCQIRLLVLSDDVIHSFAVPSLGLKVDAVPGRLNQIRINVDRAGLFYGQCSEICGVNHRFMPIVIEVTKLKKILLKLFR